MKIQSCMTLCVAFATCVLAGGSILAQNSDLTKAVENIAAELKKGNNANAKKLAAAAAKQSEMDELMTILNPPKKGGRSDDGYVVAAVAELALVMAPSRKEAAWKAHATNLRNAGLALANANAAQKANAAKAVNNVCTACHTEFR